MADGESMTCGKKLPAAAMNCPALFVDIEATVLKGVELLSVALISEIFHVGLNVSRQWVCQMRESRKID